MDKIFASLFIEKIFFRQADERGVKSRKKFGANALQKKTAISLKLLLGWSLIAILFAVIIFYAAAAA